MINPFPTFTAFLKRNWPVIAIGFVCLVVMNLVRIAGTTGFPR